LDSRPQPRDTFVESIELGFLTLATHGGVLCVLANRKPDPPALFAPFEVIGPFRVLFLSAVYYDEIRFNAPIRGENDGQYRMPFEVWTRLVRLTSRA
jgi:hypothetical protein